MPKTLIGNICAYIPAEKAGAKAQYPRIGVLFKDTESDGRFSMKLDSIPIDDAWQGWCNVFPPTPKDAKPAPPTDPDDVPF